MTDNTPNRFAYHSSDVSNKWREGDRVVALNEITDGGEPGDPNAAPITPSWIHANQGEFGWIVHKEPGEYPTVRFDRTGTASTVADFEIAEYHGRPTFPTLTAAEADRVEDALDWISQDEMSRFSGFGREQIASMLQQEAKISHTQAMQIAFTRFSTPIARPHKWRRKAASSRSAKARKSTDRRLARNRPLSQRGSGHTRKFGKRQFYLASEGYSLSARAKRDFEKSAAKKRRQGSNARVVRHARGFALYVDPEARFPRNRSRR